METQVLNGKILGEGILDRIASELSSWEIKPGLAVILVGEDPASLVYVNRKKAVAERLGFHSSITQLDKETSAARLHEVIQDLNKNSFVHGVLLQLPLPSHLDAGVFIEQIHPLKDVDGLHSLNVGRLFQGAPRLVPCTPSGCMRLIKEALPNLEGKEAVVLGRSRIVGLPVSALLQQANCTVTVLHSQSQNPKEHCRRADIVVAAMGKPQTIRKDWIKPGAVVIDVGISRCEGKLLGDVVFDEMIGPAAAITPVPGGVGPMTIAYLMVNTLVAFYLQKEIPSPQWLRDLM